MTGGLAETMFDDKVAQYIAVTMIGGAVSEAAGGDFLDGAISAAMVHLFNDVMDKYANKIALGDTEGRQLTELEKKYQLKFAKHGGYTEDDLNKVRIHTGLPLWAKMNPFIKVNAVTLGYDIYVDVDYEQNTIGGIILLGHELVHVGQYRRGELTISSYIKNWVQNLNMGPADSYYNMPFEKSAYAHEDYMLTQFKTGYVK